MWFLFPESGGGGQNVSGIDGKRDVQAGPSSSRLRKGEEGKGGKGSLAATPVMS